ncbi:MAG: ABC transporter ATP-binding protein/permease [Roseburia sp.]|nr:ABC transporter ATP-binding protein/permease [Roseburia sp.]
MKKLGVKLTYFRQMFNVLWDTDRGFLFFIFADVILTSIQPFPLIFLARESVNILTSPTGSFQELVRVALILLGVDFLIGILDNWVQYITTLKGNLIGNRLNEKIFRKCVEMDYELLSRKDIQEKRQLAKRTIEGGSFNNLTMNFRMLAANLLSLVGIAVTIASTDIWILLATVVIIGFNTIAVYKRKGTEYRASREVIPVNRKIDYYDNVSSDFSYMKEIKIFHMGEALILKQAGLLQEISFFLQKIFTGWAVTNGISIVTNTILQVLLYLLLGFKLIVKKSIVIGDFTLYLTAIMQFKMALTNISTAFVDMDNNGRYLKDYFAFLGLDNHFDKGRIPLAEAVGDDFVIAFEQVSFRYPFTEGYALRNVSCTIHKGERISVVGENGSGKTTFIKLLLRLYEPTEGVIRLNGIDIREINYSEYLEFFSAAFQDFKIFAYTIRENITALQETEDAEVWAALERIGLQDKIDRLDKGLDTYLYRIYDENGVELSGGEAQRLAIARAICKKSQVIVLDEPTAAIDAKVEAEIFKDFDKIVRNTTSISISHRMASSKSASRILVFADGELVETGSHRQLMNVGGVYAELYQLQAQMYLED